MRAADDFPFIRARMEQLERERQAPFKTEAGLKHRVPSIPIKEIARIAQQRTRELLDRA
jgi:hypothetical protein